MGNPKSVPQVYKLPQLQNGQIIQRFERYLSVAGWNRSDANDTYTVWQRWHGNADGEDGNSDGSPQVLQIVLPTRASLLDFEDLIESAIRVLSFDQKRPMGIIRNDVLASGADNLSIRLEPDTPSGEAPLGLASGAIEGIRELLLGSAVGTSENHLVLKDRYPADVKSYVDRARLSTAPGSFIIRVSMPFLRFMDASDTTKSVDIMAPDVATDPDESMLFHDVSGEVPFGRKLSRRLNETVVTASQLARRVLDDGQAISVFKSAIPSLPNATELDGLRRIGEAGSISVDYSMRVRQSPLSKYEKIQSRQLQVPREYLDVFGEAVEYIRQQEVLAGRTVVGKVVRLYRQGNFGPGEVYVESIIDETGRTRRLRAELSEPDYNAALDAHGKGMPVSITGDIIPRGKRYHINHVIGFQVLPSVL